jgi:phosphoglycerate dehydrogenase-like enzyme
MRALLVSHHCHAARGDGLRRAAAQAGCEIVILPQSRDERLTDQACARVDAAYFSLDLFPDFSRQFFSAVRKASRLEWLHVFNVGIDHPIYSEMLERGVRLTTSSGTTAQPIAQTAIAALLMLARNFPRWLAAQSAHRWEPMRGNDVPRDLEDQTVVIVGLGQIGRAIARLAGALGMKVIGVRRSATRAEDCADELYPPERLSDVLPSADWLVLACPLTAETRGLIDRKALAALRKGARLINIARGEIVDEAALIEALRAQHLAGAYLDVFQQEPLAPDSPLWDMPNVLVTPHNSSVASGNDQRVYEIFIENLRRWSRSEPLVNEVRRITTT